MKYMDKLSRRLLLDAAHAVIKFFGKPLHGYATGIGCMDGKVQGALRKWTKRTYGVKWVDLITHPGIVKVLAEGKRVSTIEDVREMLYISIFPHQSRRIVLATHFSCLGDPTEKEEQLARFEAAEERIWEMIRSFPLNEIGITADAITVDRLYINEKWMPEVFSLRHALKMSA